MHTDLVCHLLQNERFEVGRALFKPFTLFVYNGSHHLDHGDFPLLNAYQSVLGGVTDAFVARLSPDGSSLVYSTLLGGEGADGALDIAADAGGQAYIVGETRSTGFPVLNALQSVYGGSGFGTYGDAFVSVLSASGSSLVYSTYLGGGSDDAGRAIALTTGVPVSYAVLQ